MRELIGYTEKVLDDGFVTVLDIMGGLSDICAAARVSRLGAKSKSDDSRLLKFLIRHRHTSPLEMAELKVHVRAPIFVLRQWHRHRTANINEVSGRYSLSDCFCHLPTVLRSQSEENRQCSDAPLEDEVSEGGLAVLRVAFRVARNAYDTLIRLGVAREQARIVLPTAVYSEMYWKIDLHNLLNFIRLRTADDAQEEIRKYAEVLKRIVEKWIPEVFDV